MSLQTVAKHMAAQGRGPDTQLVHMTANEVAGLQALARAKGGSLTINPKTGLVEAGFLDDVGDVFQDVGDAAGDLIQGAGDLVQDVTSSPVGSMLVGAALMAAGVPPQFAGLATGVASLASGNSLGQSVGAGLGAYGGASLAGAAGVGAPTAPVGDPSVANLPGGTANATAVAPTTAPVTETVIPKEAFPVVDTTPTVAMTPVPPANAAGPAMTPVPNAQVTGAEAIRNATANPVAQAPMTGAEAIKQALANPAPATSGGIMDTLGGYYDKAGKWVAANPGTALLLAGTAGGLLGAAAKPKEAPEKFNYEGAYIRPYVYDPSTRGLRQLAPVKAPVKAARGGTMSSGPVEKMSDMNSVGANTGYPMANIDQARYATPFQTPYSQDVVSGATDVGVNPYSGEAKGYAFGGTTSDDVYGFLEGAVTTPRPPSIPAPAAPVNPSIYAYRGPAQTNVPSAANTTTDATGQPLNNLTPYDGGGVSPSSNASASSSQGLGGLGQAVVGNAVSNVAASFGLGPVAAIGLGIAAANAVGTPAAANNASVSDVGVDAANAPAVSNAVSQGTVAESSLGGLGDAGSGGVSAADGTDGSSAGPGGSSGDAAAAAAGAGPGGPGGGDGASAGAGAGGGDGGGEARGGLSPYFTYHMAGGGITGEGNLDLHIPLDFGGGAGGSMAYGNTGATMYQAAGSGNTPSGFSGYNNTSPQSVNPARQDMSSLAAPKQTGPQGLGALIAANPNMQGAFGDLGQALANNNQLRPFANGGSTSTGYNLGGYSDGGRLLKGPGDGVSDSIPATIANKQPARLADGEFVIPARIVSELGNGSTDAGARQLYKMMDRIQAARRKTTGKNKVATNSRAAKHLPA